MTHRALAVANYILDLADKDGEVITPLKLQKLVYIAHGWNLCINEEPLIFERVQAWQWGPVIEEVYREFKRFGNQPITSRGTILKKVGFDDTYQVEDFEPEIGEDEKAIDVIEGVWEAYKHYSPMELSNLTHQKGTPWRNAWKQSKDVIDDYDIKKYYERLADEDSDDD